MVPVSKRALSTARDAGDADIFVTDEPAPL
jgi:hypothetical protein